jgi:hypothetical protein
LHVVENALIMSDESPKEEFGNVFSLSSKQTVQKP